MNLMDTKNLGPLKIAVSALMLSLLFFQNCGKDSSAHQPSTVVELGNEPTDDGEIYLQIAAVRCGDGSLISSRIDDFENQLTLVRENCSDLATTKKLDPSEVAKVNTHLTYRGEKFLKRTKTLNCQTEIDWRCRLNGLEFSMTSTGRSTLSLAFDLLALRSELLFCDASSACAPTVGHMILTDFVNVSTMIQRVWFTREPESVTLRFDGISDSEIKMTKIFEDGTPKTKAQDLRSTCGLEADNKEVTCGI